jgi:hypothetical protein
MRSGADWWQLQGGAAVFHDGGGQPTDGEDSSEVLRLGEEEREVRHRSNQSENRGAALTMKGWWRGCSSAVHMKTGKFWRRGWTKGTGGGG